MTATIIPFPASRIDRIEIWCGTTKNCPERWTYFLDLVESDGARNCVHEAPSWREALLAARYWQQHGMRVVDKTGGAA